MAVADVHPSAEELAAFTLGTLGDETQASIEAHVADCTSCQERAAVAPSDTLVELLRRVHARTGRGADTPAEAAAQTHTPVLLSAVTGSDAHLPALSLSAPAELDCSEVPDALPPELARHERYRVVRLLGVGGMGAVYEAEHRVMQRPVALKVIKRAYTANTAATDRFRREVRAAARLSHPNIVVTYDAEDAGETHFLVMEYVDGTDLGRLVQERGPLPVDRACDFIRQAALGLQHAFEQGMVHRDLKPQNLMRTLDGRVRILDFGLARFASEAADAAGLTSTGIVLGTVDYIAPEQADNAHQANIRSDIYSLGCTLYHLLAGKPPFPTGTPLQKVMAHREKKPQPLTELRDDLPEGLMPVLERMMAKNPKHRYQTPAEVACALELFLRATAVRTTDPGRTVVLDRVPVGERRRPRLALAIAILAFFVAGLLGVGVYRIATDNGELVITTESDDVKVVITQGGKLVDVIDTKTDMQIRLALRSGDYELALKEAPVGLKLSVEKATLTRGKETLAKIESIKKEPSARVGTIRRFEGHPNGASGGVAFSPDGRYALSGGMDGTSLVWEVATGRIVHRLSGPDKGVGGVAFSPDGRQALTVGDDKTVRLWDVQTGKEIRVLKGHTDVIRRVVFSPDGCRALSGGDESMRLWDLESGSELRRFHGGCAVAFSPDGRRALSGGDFGRLQLCDVETGAGLRQLRGHTHWVASVVFLPGGHQALSGSMDHTLRLWDLESGNEIRRFSGHTGGVNRVATTRDSRFAVSASHDKTVRLWDLQTGKELHCFIGHTEGVLDVAISPDGKYVLSGSLDNTVRLWRLPDLPPAEKVGEVRRFEGHTGCAHYVAFSRDGRYAVSCSGWPTADNTIRLWDVSTGKQIRQFNSPAGPVFTVAFSPDGRRILYGTQYGAAILLDVATGKPVQRFVGCRGGVYVTFSPDGRRVLSASADAARVWDPDTGKELCKFEGHKDRVMAAVFSPDGKRAVSGAMDDTIYLWDVESGEKVRSFEGNKGQGELVLAHPIIGNSLTSTRS
jgi:WD40 repeat protein